LTYEQNLKTMNFDNFVLETLTEYEKLCRQLKYELISRVPLAVERGQKAKLFKEIAEKYSVTVQYCRNIYYKKKATD
jgi:hypothetical protein